jgi:hypothetical protein
MGAAVQCVVVRTYKCMRGGGRAQAKGPALLADMGPNGGPPWASLTPHEGDTGCLMPLGIGSLGSKLLDIQPRS